MITWYSNVDPTFEVYPVSMQATNGVFLVELELMLLERKVKTEFGSIANGEGYAALAAYPTLPSAWISQVDGPIK